MLSLFPRNVLDEIWDLIESLSEGFPTYFYSNYCYAALPVNIDSYLRLNDFQVSSLNDCSEYVSNLKRQIKMYFTDSFPKIN